MSDIPNSQAVYTQLRDQILDGTIPEGHELNERGLAERVGTSRTPVREALAQLVLDGLAQRQGRRTRVTIWDDERTGQLYEMRAILESEACRLAAMRRSESTLRKLDASLERQRGLKDPSPLLRREANYEFHQIIWHATGNPLLAEANEKYGVQSLCIVPTTLKNDERWDESLDEHQGLISHISAHRADEAAQLMHDHLEAAFRRTGATA